jgi:hypothetical protein
MSRRAERAPLAATRIDVRAGRGRSRHFVMPEIKEKLL